MVKGLAAGLAFLVAAIPAAGQQPSGVLPKLIVQQLTGRLPAAFSPLPASRGTKILPSFSETRPFIDRSNAVMLGDEPFCLLAVTPDGRQLEVTVPTGKKPGEYTNRWFRAEEVLGNINWKLEEYVTPCQNLLYTFRGKQSVELLAAIGEGVRCASLGTVTLGKVTYRLIHMRGDFKACGTVNTFRVLLAREAPPVETMAAYKVRAAEMLAEHAYRQGRPWGTMFPALLTKEGAYECAAMTSDFGRYLFGTGMNAGERFTDPSEIRSGDIIHLKSHFFAVVFRNGSQLHTIEGNMNSAVNQSKTYYSVKDGKVYAGGKPQEFDYGRHNLPKGL
ncbi:MAG: hypothetical protein J6334_08480 [Kiritimatiellae bacterium]|nr:hypothetical protein [Kiritimatiellia bacterium]